MALLKYSAAHLVPRKMWIAGMADGGEEPITNFSLYSLTEESKVTIILRLLHRVRNETF